MPTLPTFCTAEKLEYLGYVVTFLGRLRLLNSERQQCKEAIQIFRNRKY